MPAVLGPATAGDKVVAAAVDVPGVVSCGCNGGRGDGCSRVDAVSVMPEEEKTKMFHKITICTDL